jgi:hypothetical protein
MCRCFLNPRLHFIWAFIVPVVLLFFLNCVFFVIAATITWRQQKMMPEKKNTEKIR